VWVMTAHWGELPIEEIDEGVRVRRLRSLRKMPYKAGLPAMLGFVAASAWSGSRAIRTWKPDILHVHFAVPAGAAAWLLRKLTGTPYVLTVHLGDIPGGVPEKTGRWFRWIYPFTPPIWKDAFRITAVSEYTRQLALKSYEAPIQVIPNGVDLQALDPGEIHLNTPRRIIFAGRFMEQKNPIGLVRILLSLKDKPWRCTMLGDGPLRQAVADEISRCGLNDRIELPGWVKPEEVIACFRKSDILCMPSLSEGFPVVGVQALAMGLALVLSRVGGCIDLVREGENGFLLEPNDEAAFTAALVDLLDHPDKLLRYRVASRLMAERFDLGAVVESYAQVFSGVIAG